MIFILDKQHWVADKTRNCSPFTSIRERNCFLFTLKIFQDKMKLVPKFLVEAERLTLIEGVIFNSDFIVLWFTLLHPKHHHWGKVKIAHSETITGYRYWNWIFNTVQHLHTNTSPTHSATSESVISQICGLMCKMFLFHMHTKVRAAGTTPKWGPTFDQCCLKTVMMSFCRSELHTLWHLTSHSVLG